MLFQYFAGFTRAIDGNGTSVHPLCCHCFYYAHCHVSKVKQIRVVCKGSVPGPATNKQVQHKRIEQGSDLINISVMKIAIIRSDDTISAIVQGSQNIECGKINK